MKGQKRPDGDAQGKNHGAAASSTAPSDAFNTVALMRSALMRNPRAGTGAKKRNTCTSCRRAKIKCDRGAPKCSRCTRLNLPCIEQLRTQGRPPITQSPSGRPAGALTTIIPSPTTITAHPPLPVEMVVSKDGSSTGVRKRPMPTDAQSSSPSSSRVVKARATGSGKPPSRGRHPPRTTTFLIPLAADVLCARAVHLDKTSMLDREKLESQMRCWGHRSLRLQKDASYGVVDRVCHALDMDAGALAEARCKVSEEPDGPLEGGKRSLHAGLRGLDDGSAMVACYVEDGGRVGVYINDRFSARLMSMDEASEDLKEKQCLPVYLWGRLFTPEAQYELYDSIAGLMFSDTGEVGEVAHTLTCLERDGLEFPALVRLRHMIAPDGHMSQCILSIIPLPGSLTSTANRCPESPSFSMQSVVVREDDPSINCAYAPPIPLSTHHPTHKSMGGVGGSSKSVYDVDIKPPSVADRATAHLTIDTGIKTAAGMPPRVVKKARSPRVATTSAFTGGKHSALAVSTAPNGMHAPSPPIVTPHHTHAHPLPHPHAHAHRRPPTAPVVLTDPSCVDTPDPQASTLPPIRLPTHTRTAPDDPVAISQQVLGGYGVGCGMPRGGSRGATTSSSYLGTIPTDTRASHATVGGKHPVAPPHTHAHSHTHPSQALTNTHTPPVPVSAPNTHSGDEMEEGEAVTSERGTVVSTSNGGSDSDEDDDVGPPMPADWGRSHSTVEFYIMLSTLSSTQTSSYTNTTTSQVSTTSTGLPGAEAIDMQSFDWERTDLTPPPPPQPLAPTAAVTPYGYLS